MKRKRPEMFSNKQFVLHLSAIAFFVVLIALIRTEFASAVLDDDNLSIASAPAPVPTRKRGRPPGRRKIELNLLTDSEAPSEPPVEESLDLNGPAPPAKRARKPPVRRKAAVEPGIA